MIFAMKVIVKSTEISDNKAKLMTCIFKFKTDGKYNNETN